MGYDIKTFIQKRTFFAKHAYICVKKHLPLRLIMSCDVDPASLPNRIRFPHPVGIVISKYAHIEDGCTILQNVTIGARESFVGENLGYPTIKSGVKVGAGAIIIGDITIGKNAWIGAGATVLKDVPVGASIKGLWK